MSRNLSVFVDESGYFGSYSHQAPVYIVSLVFHDQGNSVDEEELLLEQRLQYRGLSPKHSVHTKPLIKMNEPYENLDGTLRRAIFGDLMGFFRKCQVQTKSFIINKKMHGYGDDLADRISSEMGSFLRGNLAYFQSYDKIIVYYDSGQKEITRVLRNVFSAILGNVEFRVVNPEDYRLFQIADLVCTLELAEYKRQNSKLGKSENAFFGGPRKFSRNQLKLLEHKRFGE